MIQIARAACELLKAQKPFVLATIASHSGSTPRTAGSQMIITQDGRGIGTIGGGLLEAEAMARAAELMGAGKSALLSFDLSVETADTMDMICGGRARVLLDCIAPTDADLAIFDQWHKILEAGQRGTFLSIVAGSPDKAGRVGHCLALGGGEIAGPWPLAGSEKGKVLAATSGSSEVLTLSVEGATVVAVPAGRACFAHLFGAGHVSRPTAHLAALVGFRVQVYDDRSEYANKERFPEAAGIGVLEDFNQALSGLTMGKDDYVVILTRGHIHDKTVLAQALATGAGYVGMIGSRKKRDAIYAALRNEGFTKEDIRRVHSPIGLSIGAETPEEIAVSIVSEMIAHRAGLDTARSAA